MKAKIIISLLILIIMISGCTVEEDTTPKLNEYGEPYVVEKWFACAMAHDMIKDQLKAPSTVKFEKCPTDMYPDRGARVAYLGNQEYLITSYVDSQNSFGAMVRTNYQIRVQDNGEYWDILAFQLS